LFGGSGCGNTDKDDRKHEHEVGHPSLIHAVIPAADGHSNPSDGGTTSVAHSNVFDPPLGGKHGLSGPSG
jgi:hypothetical protein